MPPDRVERIERWGVIEPVDVWVECIPAAGGRRLRRSGIAFPHGRRASAHARCVANAPVVCRARLAFRAPRVLDVRHVRASRPRVRPRRRITTSSNASTITVGATDFGHGDLQQRFRARRHRRHGDIHGIQRQQLSARPVADRRPHRHRREHRGRAELGPADLQLSGDVLLGGGFLRGREQRPSHERLRRRADDRVPGYADDHARR